MDYWPSAPWKVAIEQDGETRSVEPSLPFALIGSHESCSVRIDEKRVPSAAYLACAFADSIEVWPLTSISFPRWGVVGAQDKVLIGKTEISLIHSHHAGSLVSPDREDSTSSPSDSFASDPASLLTNDSEERVQPRPRIVLDLLGATRSKALRRRVTILGSQHPSTLRIYGFDLESCDHAIVAVGKSVWLIDLKTTEGRPESGRVTRLVPAVEPFHVGRISLAIDWRKAQSDTSLFPQVDQSGNPVSDSSPVVASEATLDSQSDFELLTKPQPVVAQVTQVTQVAQATAVPLSVQGDPTAGLHQGNVTDVGVVGGHRAIEAEAFSTRITDRLASMQQRKSLRKRIFVLFVYLVAFSIALLAVFLVVFRLLLPLVLETE